MPGIVRDKDEALIRPTTMTRVAEWGFKLHGISSQQISDWLLDAKLSYTKLNAFSIGADRGEPHSRKHYLRSAVGALDATDSFQVRRFMQVLEECLMATSWLGAKDALAHALSLDSFTIDNAGNIIDPATADLFALDLSTLDDASSLTQQLGRIHQNLHTNPEEAIDAAAALVAGALKLVIAAHGEAPQGVKLPQLAKAARPYLVHHFQEMGLSVDEVTKLTSGLVTIVNAAASIRNRVSPTHADVSARRSTIEVAELVVSAATPLVRACVGALGRPTCGVVSGL